MEKKLNLFDLISIGVGCIVGSGVFALMGFGIAYSGRGITLALFLAMLLCVLQFVFALLWALLCALVIAMLAMLAWMIPMSMKGNTNVQPSLLWWIICGVLWGLGIVVPGMSPSNIIFFFGLQAPMYAAIGNLDMSVIIPMGLALLGTVLALSKGIDYCLKKQYSIFMHAVIGIVIASTIVILPPVKVLIEPGYTFATGLSDLMIYAACFLLGAVAAWALSRIQKEEA